MAAQLASEISLCRCSVALGRFSYEGNHVRDALCTVGAEMFAQLKRPEGLVHVHLRNFRCRLVLNGGEYQRDDALCDGGVAIGKEVQPSFARRRVDPNRSRAATNFRRVGLKRVGHGLELMAKINQQPIAILAFDQLIFFKDIRKGR